MTIKWGDPIECNGVRPDWLRGRVTCDLKTAAGWGSAAYYDSENDAEDWAWSHRPGDPNVTHIRLPADHPAYVALARGFTPWSGGESAPSDADPMNGALLRNGVELHGNVSTLRYDHEGNGGDVIGYRKRVEYSAVHADGSRSGGQPPRNLTEVEVRAIVGGFDAANRMVEALATRGLIRPESRAERFTRETGHAITVAVEAALNWKGE